MSSDQAAIRPTYCFALIDMWCHGHDVTDEGRIPEKPYAVLINAMGGGGLTADIMDEWRARQRWVETGSTLTPSDLDDNAKREPIPRFAAIVADAAARGWIERWSGLPDAPGSSLLGEGEIADALADPGSWLLGQDNHYQRMVGTLLTEAGYELLLEPRNHRPMPPGVQITRQPREA